MELLLFDNNLIDFSKIFENGIVGALMILFAMTFVKPLMDSLLDTNKANAKSNSDSAVTITTMSATVSTEHGLILNAQKEHARQLSDIKETLLERDMRHQEELRAKIAELLIAVTQNSS